MPLEIRELIIKATVSGGKGSANGSDQQQVSGDLNVDEIVAKVMQIIKDKTER